MTGGFLEYRTWGQCLQIVLGGKSDMRASKAIKRASKLMKGSGDTRSLDALRAELGHELEKDRVRGFVMDEWRIKRREEASTCTEREENDFEKKKEKEKRKKEKRKKRDHGRDKGEKRVTEHKKERKSEEILRKKKRHESLQAPEPSAAAVTGALEEENPTRNAGEMHHDVSWRESLKRKDVKCGLYSKDEEEVLKDAVRRFAIERGLSTEDYSWIICTGRGQRNKETLGIWRTVAHSLPQRTIKSVAAAGVRLFHPYANKGPWTADEDMSLRALVEARGTKWTTISATLERTPEACRFRWREIKLEPNKSSGTWGKDEEDRLREAVEKYGCPRSLQTPADEKADIPDRRMLLDDINWEAVVAHVKTRSRVQCIAKWYLRLSPSMIDRGEWGVGDDRRMLRSLWSLGGHPMEHEVPWDGLVKNRTADQCKRRWKLMKKNVPKAKDLDFHGVLEHLVKRFMPTLLKP
eukprot:jgi/Picsp_1/3399/NSC_06237-R1_protein